MAGKSRFYRNELPMKLAAHSSGMSHGGHFSRRTAPSHIRKTMEQQSCDQTQEIRVRRPFMDLVKDLAVEATVPTKRGETWPGEEVPTGFEALKKRCSFLNRFNGSSSKKFQVEQAGEGFLVLRAKIWKVGTGNGRPSGLGVHHYTTPWLYLLLTMVDVHNVLRKYCKNHPKQCKALEKRSSMVLSSMIPWLFPDTMEGF